MDKMICTWCNQAIKESEHTLVHNTDPFCSQLCLDSQLHDDSLFEREEGVESD